MQSSAGEYLNLVNKMPAGSFILEGELGAGHSSGGRARACKLWDHPIEPAWRVHLQFGPFSIPTSGPSKAVLYAALSVRKCI